MHRRTAYYTVDCLRISQTKVFNICKKRKSKKRLVSRRQAPLFFSLSLLVFRD